MAVNVYNAVTKLMFLFGLFFVSFGPSFSFFLLDFLYSSKVSSTDAPKVMSYYCLFVFTMAVNGVTEAFAHAVATPSELSFFNMAMFFFSAIYILLALLLISYFKTIGLILSNCINMSLRMAFSIYFTHGFFKRNNLEKRIWEIFPDWKVLSCFLLCFFATRFSEERLCNHELVGNLGVLRSTRCYLHLFVGSFCFLSCLASIYLFERKWLKTVIQIWKEKKQ